MNKKSMGKLHWFRRMGIAEGISFLLLLFVAMPLKYLADQPQYVTYIGWAHGALFIAFMVMALEIKSAFDKGFGWLVKAFIAAILPFGTFYFDKQLKKEEEFLHKA